MAKSPALTQQFGIDRTICVGETQKAGVGAPVVYSNGSIGSQIGAAIVVGQQSSALNDVYKGCMAQRGYVLVDKKDAASVAAQFRRNKNS